jgi:hypothetical protein
VTVTRRQATAPGPDLFTGQDDAPQPVLSPCMHVKVHYNLRRGGFSVTIQGRVVANVPDITLTGPVQFQVEPSGRPASAGGGDAK